ncbi:MAG TPA: mobile mystery protein A [Puia sp.]|nr:mobile mystery protein A [Puia sp.]
MPSTGWIRSFRQTLQMSLAQLAEKMSVSASSVWAFEKREEEGTIQIKTLAEFARALDMTFVYGFIPRDGSLEKLIERKARTIAERIVRRTSVSMELEDQGTSEARQRQAVDDLTEELKRDMPKYLWD